MTQPKLTLVMGVGLAVPSVPLPGPPLHRLVAAVVDAARAWSAEASSTANVIATNTEEGALRLAVLDAVHDLEHAETNNGRIPQTGERPLFGDGA